MEKQLGHRRRLVRLAASYLLVGLRLPIAATEEALRASATHPAVLKTIVAVRG